jgi:hypothetical protein
MSENNTPTAAVQRPVGHILPTTGRKIYYRPEPGDNGMAILDKDKPAELRAPLDATIVYVHNPELVNLCVKDHNGNTYPIVNVPLVQAGQLPPPDGGEHCHWMDFQIRQSVKAAIEQATITTYAEPVGAGLGTD